MTDRILIVVTGDPGKREITVFPTVARVARGSTVTWRAVGVDRAVLVFRDAAVTDGHGGFELTSSEKKQGELTADEQRCLAAFGGRLDKTWVEVQGKVSESPGLHPYQLVMMKGNEHVLDLGCPEVIIQ